MERRKYPRKKVVRPLAVHDLSRGVGLGRLADISLDGLMLLSSEDIPIGRVFQLALEFPDELECGIQAEFGAESLWAEASLEPAKYWVGFHIIDIAPENAHKVRCLIDAL